ncbi:hypothetical protein HMPREF1020_02501 [Clostridium sp. 7_3_54FAA]|nr:hypothetical protein HMPREF1020_02501 [Clostridium sp. 7_3_54FAA]
MSGVARRLAESSVPGLEVVVRGESGRNELLRGPFALFGVRGSAKLVRNLAKHRRTPMSPPQLIPPTSPGQVSDGDGRLRRRFSHTGHGPFRALIVSNLKWGGPCRSPRPRQSSPGTIDSYTHPTTPSASLRRRPHVVEETSDKNVR